MRIKIDGWEQRKLGDIATFINGRAYSQEELLSSGKYKVLRVGNFYTNDSWYYSDMELEDKYYAEEGDLLYTWSATFGPHIWHGDKIIYHYHIWKVELSDTLEKHFAVQLLEKDKQSILSDKNGSTMVHITKAGMESKEVMLPPNIREQAEIGKYLQNIDHLITLHQRKCEQTKTLKKYMLQKMFPQDGEKVPQIRFEGFTEDWEQRKLGDLTKELSDYATMASGLPLLTSSRSGLMYQSDFRDRKTTTSDETLFSIVPKGSCTYRHMSDDDIFHLNINVLEKGLVSREYPVFISSEDNDLEFIIQHINSSDRFRGFCKGQKKGGTRTRLYYKTLCEFEMMTPLIEEQKKISATLHNLDHLITLHLRKQDKRKKGSKNT